VKRHIKGRLLAATLLIVAWVFYSHFYIEGQRKNGRETYLANQARRYDRFIAQPSIVCDIAVSIVFSGSLLFVYEALTFGLSKLFSDRRSNDKNI